MNCSNCGKQVKDGVSFCPHCGNVLKTSSQDKNAFTATQPKKWKIPLIIGGISLVVILVVGAIVVSVFKRDKAVSTGQTINGDSGIVVSEVDKVTKKMSDSEKIFTAFENTVKAPSYTQLNIFYDGEMTATDKNNALKLVSEKYLDNGIVYMRSDYDFGNAIVYTKDRIHYISEATSSGKGEDTKVMDRLLDFSDIDLEEDREDARLLNSFKTLQEGKIDDLWSSTMLFESGSFVLPYRHLKTAISTLMDTYQEDKGSLNFVKSYTQEGNTFYFELYAMDFYLWYDKLSDTYDISSETKEMFSEGEFSDVSLEISFSVEGDYLSEFAIFHTKIMGGDLYKDGVQMSFSNINSLSQKTSEAYHFISTFEQQVKAGDYKYALKQYLESYMTKNNKFTIINEPEGIPVLIEKGDFTALVYDGYFYKEDERYKLNDFYESIKNAEYYRADVILDYVENGTPLPEIPAWKKAYAEYLTKNGSSDYKYHLVCIDSDDIPELLISDGESRFSEMHIVAYHDGVAEMLQVEGNPFTSGSGSIVVDVKKGIIRGNQSGAGWHSTFYYQLKNGGLYQLHSYFSEGERYTVDGEEVTEQEYSKQYNENEALYENSDQYTYSNGKSKAEIIDIIDKFDSKVTQPLSNSSDNLSSSDYILPVSDSQYLSEQDLSSLSKEQLRLARNEIYARHGLLFTKDDTKQYFEAKSWYKGTVTDVTDNMLNEYEIANRDLIILMEGN